ncbi:MAG: ABC transporter permease [Elusimicrobiales bacterium]
MRIERARAIAAKEFKHLLRDPFTLALALGLPLVLLLFFGFVIDLNYDRIPLSVRDRDNSRLSRDFAQKFTSSGYFARIEPESGASPVQPLDSGEAVCSLVINERFGRRGGGAQMLVDGSDNARAGAALGYIAQITEAASTAPEGAPQIRTRFMFNPEFNSRWFVVPGLAVVIIGVLSVLLTALTVAREWERGSMELLLSTPARPSEIVAGKLAPYFLLGLAGAAAVYAAGRLVFSVPAAGDMAVYWLACAMFVTAALAQGLLISVLTRQQQIAMQFAMVSGLLPAFLLSGFIFPVENMPLFFKYLTAILPPRWFMEISRGIFLKGGGLAGAAGPLCALAALDAVLITLATLKFKTDVEP